jgi:hypothetical protein
VVALALVLNSSRVPFVAALALTLAACGRGDRNVSASAQSAATRAPSVGPQALVLRISRAGDPPRVYAYDKLESTVWTATDPAPTPAEILAFSDDGGSVAYEDTRGRPVELELRMGTIVVASAKKQTGLASADGVAIYGVTDKGEVVRTTPTGEWIWKPPQAANAVFPMPEGGLLVSVGNGANRRLLKIHPPERKILDSIAFPVAARSVRTQLGDRVYLAVDSGLIVLRTRTMDWAPPVHFDEPIAMMASTPSGDRVFVLTRSRRTISVVDRYQEKVTAEIELPGDAEDLRVDQFGRYLLARASGKDSLWVVAIGTERVIGALRSAWRADLPFVGYDGSVVVASGNDVFGFDGETLRQRFRVAGGGQDFWYPFLWDGFRPRSASLDEPVRFDTSKIGIAADSTFTGDTTGARPATDSTEARGFIVSFAAFLTEDRADELAARIKVGGETARVVPAARGGATIYRVVLGPYLTRDEAERAGKESGHAYWVFEGLP